MESGYKCIINICFLGGDIQFDVSSDTHLFSFKSGIGFVAIPQFLLTLSKLYKGEIKQAQLECHGNFDYYNFFCDGNNIFIEHISHYPKGIYKYQFNLKKYLEAVDKGFQRYLKQLESEGILPLKSQDFAHPLGEDVLNTFYDFSSLLNS